MIYRLYKNDIQILDDLIHKEILSELKKGKTYDDIYIMSLSVTLKRLHIKDKLKRGE